MREGAIVGVTGTPALFVNGIPAPSGAIPYETVSEFIEEELRRLE
jgi:protein-disulfide isomerase